MIDYARYCLLYMFSQNYHEYVYLRRPPPPLLHAPACRRAAAIKCHRRRRPMTPAMLKSRTNSKPPRFLSRCRLDEIRRVFEEEPSYRLRQREQHGEAPLSSRRPYLLSTLIIWRRGAIGARPPKLPNWPADVVANKPIRSSGADFRRGAAPYFASCSSAHY